MMSILCPSCYSWLRTVLKLFYPIVINCVVGLSSECSLALVVFHWTSVGREQFLGRVKKALVYICCFWLLTSNWCPALDSSPACSITRYTFLACLFAPWLPRLLAPYVVRSCSLTCLLSHLLTQLVCSNSHAHYLTCSFSHLLTPSPAHSLTCSLSQLLILTCLLLHLLVLSLAHSLNCSFSPAHSLTCLFSHLLTTSPSHSLTCSLPHLLILSLAHSLTCSFSHSLTCSFSHLLTLSPARSLTCTLPHQLVLSLAHYLTSSFSHLRTT